MDFILVIAFMLIAMGVATMRGASRSVFRVVLVVISFVGALASVLMLKASAVSDQTIAQVAELAGADISSMLNQISEYSPSLVKILVGSSVSFLAPMIFLVLFIAFLVVTWALYFVVTLILFPLFHKKEKNTKARKVKALAVGAIQGALVLFFVLSPISYYGTVVNDAIPALEESGMVDTIAEATGLSGETVKANLVTEKSVLMELNSNLGGKAFCNLMTGFSFTTENGEKVEVVLSDEIDPLIKLVSNFTKLTAKPMEEYGEEEATAIEKIGEAFSESPLMKTVSCELVGGLTEAWQNGETYASVAKPEVGEPTNVIFDNIIKIFNESAKNSDNIGTDVQDISKIVAVMVKSDIMKDMNNAEVLLEKLSSSNAINDVTGILRSNERLRPLISDITNLSIYVLADTIGVPADKEEAYVNMLNDIAAKLNETKDMDVAERIETLTPFIKDKFDTIGADVSAEYIGSVTQALITDFGDVEEVTPEFIAEFFAVYEQNRGELEGGTTDVSDNKTSETAKLDEKNGYTFHKYQTEEGRTNSGAAIIGKLDAKIIEITGKDATSENKREEINQAVEQIMAPIFNGIMENAQDKEKAESVIKNYSETVGALSENTKDANVESSNNLVSFAKSTSANINCMTLTDIKDKFATSSKITDEKEAEKHGQIINDVVNCASSLLAATKKNESETPEGGEGEETNSSNSLDVLKATTEGLGTILDTLSQTELYGKDDTAKLMQTILTSETVSNVIPITKEEADKIVNQVKDNENVSYGSLMTGVSGMAELVISMTDGKCSEESVKNLILGLDEHNVEAILVIVSEKRFESMGIKGDKVAPTNEIMKILFLELAKVPENEVDTEAKAVKKLIEVALEAKSGGTGLFGEEGRIGDPTLFIEEVLSSKAVCNTVITTEADPFGVSEKISDADKDAFGAACEAYIGTENEATVVALAAVLGITVA